MAGLQNNGGRNDPHHPPGGPEFDLDNLVTLCFDCHHLGRHGAKTLTPDETAQNKVEAEKERLQVIRSRHRCLDSFSQSMGVIWYGIIFVRKLLYSI